MKYCNIIEKVATVMIGNDRSTTDRMLLNPNGNGIRTRLYSSVVASGGSRSISAHNTDIQENSKLAQQFQVQCRKEQEGKMAVLDGHFLIPSSPTVMGAGFVSSSNAVSCPASDYEKTLSTQSGSCNNTKQEKCMECSKVQSKLNFNVRNNMGKIINICTSCFDGNLEHEPKNGKGSCTLCGVAVSSAQPQDSTVNIPRFPPGILLCKACCNDQILSEHPQQSVHKVNQTTLEKSGELSCI